MVRSRASARLKVLRDKHRLITMRNMARRMRKDHGENMVIIADKALPPKRFDGYLNTLTFWCSIQLQCGVRSFVRR